MARTSGSSSRKKSGPARTPASSPRNAGKSGGPARKAAGSGRAGEKKKPAKSPNQPSSEFLNICDYGLLGNGRTATLVGRDGSVGWLCIPRFDSASIVASILDPQNGGSFRVHPTRVDDGKQHYAGRTNVLVTEFGKGGAKVKLTDWMPVRFGRDPEKGMGEGALCRVVHATGGDARIEARCAPRREYGAQMVHWKRVEVEGTIAWRAHGPEPLWLVGAGMEDARMDEHGGLRVEFSLRAGEERAVALAWGTETPEWRPGRLTQSLREATQKWKKWIAKAQYSGPYADAVLRSALVLRALVYEPSGAIVAAPTTSLPEAIGGPRNWDYRFCWPRDATFALYGLSLLGFHEEAGEFLRFLCSLVERHPLPLQVCYRVDGDAQLPERDLHHLRGYRDSRPVRIGNGAVNQKQLDIYGEILDAGYTYAKWRGGLEDEVWAVLRQLADYAAAHCHEADNSIWEVRGGERQFVYSKVMCWVALDRAIKLTRKYKLPGDVERWKKVGDDLHAEVLRRGFDEKIGAFTQSFDDPVLDASALLLPLVRFITPRDPRMKSTIRAVLERLTKGPFVKRYENPHEDGVGGPEGAFLICSFWLIDCLTLLGDTARASDLLEQILDSGSPLGLFSEELEPQGDGTRGGEMIGNFPQAFTHMALINAAHNLELYPRGVPKRKGHGKR